MAAVAGIPLMRQVLLPSAIDAASQVDGSLSAAAGQLLDLYYSAKDFSADLINRLDGYDTNDAELDEIEQRIDRIYKLKRKYGDTHRR